MESVTLSLHAMATRFELVLWGEDPVRLRAAGEESLAEIARLDAQLSFYRPGSELSLLNNRAADSPVKVEPRFFQLLQDCACLTRETDGAFDVTVGPLMRAWRFIAEGGNLPAPNELEAARARVGMDLVQLNPATFTVRFRRPGVEIDLGGYGKGYAVERAIASLKEMGINSALLHGGTSSVCAIGAPPDAPCWRIALQAPLADQHQPLTVALVDEALSVSAVHGKSFVVGGCRYGHVIDPRTGQSVAGNLAAAVVGQSAATCEALSTALLVVGPNWLPKLPELFPGYRAVVAYEADTDQVKVASCGVS